MRQLFTSRRVVLSTVICFVLILTFYRSYESSAPVGSLSPQLDDTPCHIWPDWEDSSPAHLLYNTIKTKNRPVVGDAAFIGDPDRCLLAGRRLEQYQTSEDRNWEEVRWGDVQRSCAARRQREGKNEFGGIWHQLPEMESWKIDTTTSAAGGEPGRTAIVLRTWDNYNYSESRRAWLRALIAETSLHSGSGAGGTYEVFLLVNVKDASIPLDTDEVAYERTLRASVPAEFRDMALLYNSRVLARWYPQVKEHGAQDQMYQALQIFAHRFPRFAHVWQVEMDLRLTGHAHATLERAGAWAQAQPRRNLWERNGRFYIPQLHGGSYSAFAAAVDADIGVDGGVWGPAPADDFEPKGPEPPPRSQTDWGAGEDADLVSLMPMIDTNGTEWIYEGAVHGFAGGAVGTPQRAAFVSMTRASRRLLLLVSEAQREKGQWLVSEATLETFALLHGLKAVSVPHPIAFESGVSPRQADALVNRGPPHSRAGGNKPSMAYTKSGWVAGPWGHATYWFAADEAPNYWHRYLRGECMPPMLLHPVKDE